MLKIALKNYLTISTICRPERTAFVVFLEKSKVQIPLIYSLCFEFMNKVQFILSHNIHTARVNIPVVINKLLKKC